MYSYDRIKTLNRCCSQAGSEKELSYLDHSGPPRTPFQCLRRVNHNFKKQSHRQTTLETFVAISVSRLRLCHQMTLETHSAFITLASLKGISCLRRILAARMSSVGLAAYLSSSGQCARCNPWVSAARSLTGDEEDGIEGTHGRPIDLVLDDMDEDEFEEYEEGSDDTIQPLLFNQALLRSFQVHEGCQRLPVPANLSRRAGTAASATRLGKSSMNRSDVIVSRRV